MIREECKVSYVDLFYSHKGKDKTHHLNRFVRLKETPHPLYYSSLPSCSSDLNRDFEFLTYGTLRL